MPIIGQPFKLHAWWASIVLICGCGQSAPVILLGMPGQAQGACPACGRIAVLSGMDIDPQTGHPRFNFGVGQAQDPSTV